MATIFEEVSSESEYNPLAICEDAPYTQAYFYGEWQEAVGRKIRRFVIKKDDEAIAMGQMVKYPLIKNKHYLVVHHGPIVKQINDELAKLLFEEWQKIGRQEGAIFIKFDCFPPIDNSELLIKAGFKKSDKAGYHSSYVQPRYEWVLDIEKDEARLLVGMHQKTRYNIGLARRKGVEVEITDNLMGFFDKFIVLSRATAERDKFKLHPEKYYKVIFENCQKQKNGFLSIAKYRDNILAMILIVNFGKTAMYLFGASSNEERNMMAPYLAQWEGILEAKKRGMKIYNFGGYKGPENFYQSYERLSTFKERFGGRMLEYDEYYDLIINPIWYKLYYLRKKLRAR